ncbi:FdhF/YdeP family oxidoreductase [soil metagenome]
MSERARGWDPSLWVSLKPFGVGEQHPNNFAEIARTVKENATDLPYAWRILTQGVCDGCALGTTGLHDWTIDGVHLCNIRLRLLKLNTMGPLDLDRVADARALEGLSGAELRDLGRLPVPLRRRRGEAGFTPISWDEALDTIAARIRASGPDRVGAYLTSRGMCNESYYVVGKAVRAMGTNSVDNAARVCHSPSTVALKSMVGVAATTCSYTDWIGSDLVVFVGSNVANNQPVATKYLYLARRQGTRIATVNPYREPGMERYWIPSVVESALFGTKLATAHWPVATGGDAAFFTGVLRHLVERGWWDREFVAAHTTGFEEVADHVTGLDWEKLEAHAGLDRDAMLSFAMAVHEAKTGVLVWSMGATQHPFGEENVRAIVNVGLSQGWLGKRGCGLMPIRGHSGVQGGAEMGCYATALPGGAPITPETTAALGRRWGFTVPTAPGLTVTDQLDAALAGDLDVLLSVGGNFLDVLPDPARTRTALETVPLRVHMDLTMSSQMLVEGEEVLVLPATTRYEGPGGLTETTTERRVAFSPEIPGRRIGQARPEWDVFGDLAARVRPELAEQVWFASTAAIRAEIAEVVPFYDGIQHLAEQGDAFQYGGPHLCPDGRCPTPDGRAHFVAVPPPQRGVPDGRFLVSTRRGKQFNSMVHERRDKLNGATREAVLVARADADTLGLRDGDAVRLASDHGRLDARVLVSPIAPGNLQVHWPEGNVLLAPEVRSSESHVPDYNAVVDLEPL